MVTYSCARCGKNWDDDRPVKNCPFCGAHVERGRKKRVLRKTNRYSRRDKWENCAV